MCNDLRLQTLGCTYSNTHLYSKKYSYRLLIHIYIDYTQRLHSSSFLGLPYRLLCMNPLKKLLWSLWVYIECTFIWVRFCAAYTLGYISYLQVHRLRQQAVGGEEASASTRANVFGIDKNRRPGPEDLPLRAPLCKFFQLSTSFKKPRAYIGIILCGVLVMKTKLFVDALCIYTYICTHTYRAMVYAPIIPSMMLYIYIPFCFCLHPPPETQDTFRESCSEGEGC